MEWVIAMVAFVSGWVCAVVTSWIVVEMREAPYIEEARRRAEKLKAQPPFTGIDAWLTNPPVRHYDQQGT